MVSSSPVTCCLQKHLIVLILLAAIWNKDNVCVFRLFHSAIYFNVTIPENYLCGIFLIKFQYLCTLLSTHACLLLFWYLNMFFVTCNRGDCPWQQTTGNWEKREQLVRGAGVGRTLGMSCDGVPKKGKELLHSGAEVKRGPTVIRCSVWDLKDLLLWS